MKVELPRQPDSHSRLFIFIAKLYLFHMDVELTADDLSSDSHSFHGLVFEDSWEKFEGSACWDSFFVIRGTWGPLQCIVDRL